jgi:hypothetical protein
MARMGKVDFSELQKFVDKVETVLDEDQVQLFMEACAKELAARLLTKVIKRTPVGVYPDRVGGTLRRGWTAEKQQGVMTYVNSLNVTHSGDSFTIEIVNPVEYASYVEFGHRTRNHKGWVEGKFMLTISSQEVQEAAPGVLEKKLERKLGEAFK